MVLTLLDNHDQSLFTKGSVLSDALAFLGPGCPLSYQFPFYTLPRTCIIVHFVSALTCTYETRSYFQFPLPRYLQSAPYPYLTIWLSRSWGSLLSLLPYSWYHQTNRLSMVSKYYFVPGVNSRLFFPILSYWLCDVLHKLGCCTSLYKTRRPLSASSYKSCRNLSTSPSVKNVRVQSSIEWSYFWP